MWARKNAFLWAVLPPAAVLLVEAMILQSHNFADFLGRRFAGVIMVMDLPDSDGLSAPSLGITPESMSAAFEFSSSAEGGIRSLKGCSIHGGSSQIPGPRIVVKCCDILLPSQ